MLILYLMLISNTVGVQDRLMYFIITVGAYFAHYSTRINICIHMLVDLLLTRISYPLHYAIFKKTKLSFLQLTFTHRVTLSDKNENKTFPTVIMCCFVFNFLFLIYYSRNLHFCIGDNLTCSRIAALSISFLREYSHQVFLLKVA